MNINKFKKFGIVAIVSFAFGLSGCASIVHGTKEKFTINSKPNHASLKVDGAKVGATPTQVDLTRKKDHTIKLQLAGYEPKTVYLQRTLSGWIVGNVVFGGLIGIAIDAIDGAMYNLTPQQMSTYAKSKGKKVDKDANTLTIILVKSANKDWQKIGQLNKKSAKS
jgi:hypothetical protein